MAQPDLSHQGLEAVPAGDRGTRVSLILIDDVDVSRLQPKSWARCTRSYCRAVLPMLSRTWARVDWRT
jgi:hypothetical protein